MLLVVGLGNPGRGHARNRHNVGFMAVDEIARRYGFARSRRRFNGETAEGRVAGAKLLALKPLTYMNASGRPVAEAARFYKIPPERIFVVHDDVDLAPGKVRAKLGGGHAGHNGLRSVESHIGSGYWRIRVGVGRPGPGGDVSGYVLRNFTGADRDWLAKTLPAIADALPLLLSGDAPGFMTRVALLTKPPRPPAKKKAKEAAKDKAEGKAEEKAKEKAEEPAEEKPPLAAGTGGAGGGETGPGGKVTGPGGSETGPGGKESGPGGSKTGPGKSETGPGGKVPGPGGSETGPGGKESGPAGAGPDQGDGV